MLRTSRGVLVPITRGFDQQPSPNFTPRRKLIVPVQRSWNPISRALDKTFKRQYRQLEPLIQYILGSKWTPSPALLTDPLSSSCLPLFDSLPALESEIVTEGKGDFKKYRLNVFLGKQFSHDDIKITLKDHVLTMKAKAEKQSDGERFYQQVTRSIILPEKTDVTPVKSHLTSSGVLKIDFPIPKEAVEMKPIEIPINICT